MGNIHSRIHFDKVEPVFLNKELDRPGIFWIQCKYSSFQKWTIYLR
jgi:hypothetical protein